MIPKWLDFQGTSGNMVINRHIDGHLDRSIKKSHYITYSFFQLAISPLSTFAAAASAMLFSI